MFYLKSGNPEDKQFFEQALERVQRMFSRMIALDNVILSPHAAFFSVQSEVELRRKAAQNLVSFLRGGRPDYVVVAGTRRP